MRTKRKFAHELYPHPAEGEVQPLHQAVPYLYAIARGMEVWETDWFDLSRPEDQEADPERANLARRLTVARTIELIYARQCALHADALLQGLAGTDAWQWAEERMDEEGGWIYERAIHYGVPVAMIKPYYVVAEPDYHRHFDDMETRSGVVTRVSGPESECPVCCEPDPVVSEDLFGAASEEPRT